jgi:DNA polymerase-4
MFETPILHADLDAFYASVEQRDDPRLRGRPVAVGGGVVLSASYEARAYGVRGAMGGGVARRLCPGLVVVAPRGSAYVEASKAVFSIFHDVTPMVEGLSIDEAFLDLGGLRRIARSAVDLAQGLKKRVAAEVGLPITVGLARTKFLAKVASGVAKPDGLLAVPPAGELDFLHPLPVTRLWGVGAVTARKLHEAGIFTVGEVASAPARALISLLGPAAGRQLLALAHNQDPRPIEIGKRRGSVGSQRALGLRTYTPAEIDPTLIALVDRVARRLRKAGRVGRTVVVRLRLADFTRVTRSHTLPWPTSGTGTVLVTARRLVAAAEPLIAARGLNLLGVAVANLSSRLPLQLELPFEAGGELDETVDELQDRFGRDAVTRAVLLGHTSDLIVPMLPD